MRSKSRALGRSAPQKVAARKLLKFAIGDKIKTYLICNPDGAPASGPANALGGGGSGIVYAAEQEIHEGVRVKRAVKFFAYREDIALRKNKVGNSSVSHREFLTEVLNIARFSHENLVKVVDAGLYESEGVAIPFIVTEYIQGITLEDLLNDPDKADCKAIRKRIVRRPEFVLELLSQIGNGLMT